MLTISTTKFYHYLTTLDRLVLCRRDLTKIEPLIADRFQAQLQSNLNILRLCGRDDWPIGVTIESAAYTICTSATINYVGNLLNRIQELTDVPFGHVTEPRIAFVHSYDKHYPFVRLCSATLRTAVDNPVDKSVGWAEYKEWRGHKFTPQGMPENCMPEYYTIHAANRAAAPELHQCLDLLALWARNLFGLSSHERRDCLVLADLYSIAASTRLNFKDKYRIEPVSVVAAARIVGLLLNSRSDRILNYSRCNSTSISNTWIL